MQVPHARNPPHPGPLTAHVCVARREAAKAALAMNGKDLGERALRVTPAPLAATTTHALSEYQPNKLNPLLQEMEKRKVESKLSAMQQLIQQAAAIRAAQRLAMRSPPRAPTPPEERERREQARKQREEDRRRREEEWEVREVLVAPRQACGD